MCTLYNGWSEVKTLLQKIASARMPPLESIRENKYRKSFSLSIAVKDLSEIHYTVGVIATSTDTTIKRQTIPVEEWALLYSNGSRFFL